MQEIGRWPGNQSRRCWTWLGGLAIAAGVSLATPGDAAAQLRALAPQVSYADATDLGLGARAYFSVEALYSGLETQIGFDLFFPDSPEGVDLGYFEVNANLVKHFDLESTDAVVPYAGGGFNFARSSVERSGTPFVSDASEVQIGLNLLGGVRIEVVDVSPFVEARFELSGGEQAVVTGGVRIPVS